MCFFIFLCFNRVCGFLCVYNILVNYMFQVYVYVMFMYKAYIFVSRPCFSSKFLDHFIVYSLFLGDQMVLCFIIFPSIQKTFIQKLHHLFASFYVSCIIFLTCHIFIGCISFMFYILGFFLIVFFSFSFL